MNSYPSTSRLRAARRPRKLQENRRTLQLNDVWSPRARTAIRITCIEGRCWVTRAGDPADYLLEPGMSFSVCSGDGMVVQALADGTVLLVEGPLRDELARR